MRLFTHEALTRVYLYGTETVTSSPALEVALAGATSYSLMALCDEADRAGTLTAWLQHSPDGDTWTDVSVTPEISSGAIDVSMVTLLSGSFTGAVALGPRVRVAARLASTAVARVTLVVTGRGARRAAPSGVVKRVAGGSARPGGCGCGGACAQRGKAEPDEGEPGVSYLYGADAPAAKWVAQPPELDTPPPIPKPVACMRCAQAAYKQYVADSFLCKLLYDANCAECKKAFGSDSPDACDKQWCGAWSQWKTCTANARCSLNQARKECNCNLPLYPFPGCGP